VRIEPICQKEEGGETGRLRREISDVVKAA